MNIGTIHQQCHAAMAVYVWLLKKAAKAGRATLAVTRKQIAREIGVKSMKTITSALQVLQCSKVLKYRRKTKVNTQGETVGAFLIISLRKEQPITLQVLTFPQRKEQRVTLQVQGTSQRKEQWVTPPSLEEGEGGPSATATVPSPHISVHPIDAIKKAKEQSA